MQPLQEEVALLEATNSWVKWLGVWALEPDVRSGSDSGSTTYWLCCVP